MADTYDQPAHEQNSPDVEEHMSVGRYIATRFPTLVPPMNPAPNPFKALTLLNRQQWMFFAVRTRSGVLFLISHRINILTNFMQVAFCGWTWDAFDFFTVSLTTSQLAKTFDKSITDITWGITLVLMLRSIGAIIFGIASDRYGRKWPFVVNQLLFVAIELGGGFCQTYKQFLACRAIFGIAMGGLYGNAAATALEDCPPEARGIISGLLQQGYAFGYLLATAFARGLVDTTPHGWRPLYWFAACPPLLIIAFRLCLPETETFRRRQEARAEMRGGVAASFMSEGKVAFKRHWLLLIYLVLLMAGFNFMVRTLTLDFKLNPFHHTSI
jgi:SHS family lactate transporter-like MFS transporter